MDDIWYDSVFQPSHAYSTHEDALNTIGRLESSHS